MMSKELNKELEGLPSSMEFIADGVVKLYNKSRVQYSVPTE